jgi:hypothetical protein
MALSYKDMMFECVFNNLPNKTHKRQTSYNLINLTKKKVISEKYFQYDMNKGINFNDLLNLYSDYEYIIKDYKIIVDIFESTSKLSKEEKRLKRHYYPAQMFLYGINFSIIYYFHRITIYGKEGYNYLIKDLKDKYDYIKKDTDIPEYLQFQTNQIKSFYEKNINTNTNTITINDYNILELLNENFNPYSVILIDILNRYFKHLSSEFDLINFGIYVINEDASGADYQSFAKTKIQTENNLNILIHNINNYRKNKIINNFEIKYQSDNNLQKKIIYTKLNFIINHGHQFTLNVDTYIKYLNQKLIEGGNIILFLNDDTPIKTKFIRILSNYFYKVIITKVTFEPSFNWVFIGKGYTGEYIKKTIIPNQNINNFINYSFDTYCKRLNKFLKNVYNVTSKFNEKELIKEINKKYIELYRWCLNNNINAINIFSDVDKEPQLIKDSKIINYLFPNQKGINKSNLKLFNVSVYSITQPIEASKISDRIKNIFSSFFKYSYSDINMLSITDGTANVGGNTINFSYNFNKVNTIEIDKNVFYILKHNCINVYHRKNIFFYQGDCRIVVPTLKQDIIFIDPPWEGLMYKAYDKLHLYLGQEDIFEIVKKWYIGKLAKLYVIKCPANLDFELFIKEFGNIYIEKLKNYNVIYIH